VTDVGNLVQWDGRKWPDRRHWQFEMRRLGEDAHGAWFFVPVGATVRRGDEPSRALRHGIAMLVPRDTWWTVEFYWDHPEWSLYVNIGTPCESYDDRVRQVDLDLDVVRTRDGRVQTLDEDEFELHQGLYAYPPDLIRSARKAADEVAILVNGAIEPFGHAADPWIEQVRDKT
jgi:protein associated with RNAse G/E